MPDFHSHLTRHANNGLFVSRVSSNAAKNLLCYDGSIPLCEFLLDAAWPVYKRPNGGANLSSYFHTSEMEVHICRVSFTRVTDLQTYPKDHSQNPIISVDICDYHTVN